MPSLLKKVKVYKNYEKICSNQVVKKTKQTKSLKMIVANN